MKQQMVLDNKRTTGIWNTQVAEEIATANHHSPKSATDKITIKSLNLNQTSINRMLKLRDNTNIRIFGIYLTFSGEPSGQCIIVAEQEMMHTLIDMMANEATGTTKSLHDVEEATIGETGNIISTILLNAIATAYRITLLPNPSTVIYDTADALYDIASAEMVSGNSNVYLLETIFMKENIETNGTFLIMLNPDVISSKSGKGSLLRSRT